MSSRKARPLNSRPRPNLRGMDGLTFRAANLTQTQAMTGASTMMATELTLWNQAVGKMKPPRSRLTI